MLPPRRRVVERDSARVSRFRRLDRDQERLAGVPTGFHLLAVAMIVRKHAFAVLGVL